MITEGIKAVQKAYPQLFLMALEQSLNTSKRGGKNENTVYVIINEIIDILSFPKIYFLIDTPDPDSTSAVWSVIQKPDKLIIRDIILSFNVGGQVVRDSIIQPLDISHKPHKKPVITSFLKKEKAEISSQITENNTT